MKVGDLVIYKPWGSTYEGTGLVHAIVTKSYGESTRYKVSWPGKPQHIGKTMTWEAARNIEVINESR
jgi:hypothetical protein